MTSRRNNPLFAFDATEIKNSNCTKNAKNRPPKILPKNSIFGNPASNPITDEDSHIYIDSPMRLRCCAVAVIVLQCYSVADTLILTFKHTLIEDECDVFPRLKQ